jgi:hypothetical protein
VTDIGGSISFDRPPWRWTITAASGDAISFSADELYELAKLAQELLRLRAEGRWVMVITPSGAIVDVAGDSA